MIAITNERLIVLTK